MRIGRLRSVVPTAPATPATEAAPRPLDVFGRELPRVSTAKPQEHVRFGDRVLGFAYRVMDHSPLGHHHRAKADADAAMREPLTTGKRFGDVTVVANGLLNLETAAGTLFRIARYTDGPVVIASNNPTGGNALNLRPLTEIEGVPVPDELRGRLFVIGDEAPHITPWTDASDLLLEQLDVMAKRFDGFESKQVAVIGYSQGALSAMSARKRLDDAGKSGVIDRLVSLAGAIDGTKFGENPVLHAALGRVDDETGHRALHETSTEAVQAEREKEHLGPELIDLAYGVSADGGGKGVEPFFRLTRMMQPHDRGADGVIQTVQPGDAQRVVVDEKPKTHLRLWQDWRTVDTVAAAL